ncbi:MAG TPA: argininosuccinate lyase [Deltaproteobacteria bacterium]|nr:argininosuccinate lyase [Deltaproteobacteria bacterium]HCY20072.1 argininosuccinate lyase [Deltaproteobacteria bacterium]
MMASKPWSGRFTEKTDKLVEEFNASISFDKRLYKHDIMGSITHARMLAKVGILTKKEVDKIISGLKAIEKEIVAGKFRFTPDLEDIHMAIEKRLIEKIGPVGGKLHTARSRNDQVALDVRLYLRDEIKEIQSLIRDLQKALVNVAKKNLDCIMPGYTHLQRAQPILFSHHLLAYYEMLKRDHERIADCLTRVNVMPLGAGALAGSPYPLDRDFVAKELGFAKPTDNSLDSVSDRDFCIEFCGAASILMMHLSRLSEEFILWSSQEFGFIELSDAFSTGSSIMPQKKNPDVPELVRGKTGRVYGNLLSLLTTMKALPLAYNKDMQEDKEALFDTVDTVKDCLKVFSPMLTTMKINKKKMLNATKQGFLTATDAADYLVKKGVPFRESHHITGRVVAYCIKTSQGLEDLSIDEWRGFSKAFGKDIKEVISVEASVKSKKAKGGTAPEAVKRRLKEIEREMR